MLLDLMKQSQDMALEVSLYKKKLYENEGKHDYRELLAIFNRTIMMESEATNDKALLRAVSGEQSTKPPKSVNAIDKPCKFGDACNVAGCQFKHPGKPNAKATGKSSSAKASGKTPAKSPAKGKADAKARSKTPPPDKKKTPCYKWNLGACPKAESDCPFAHRAVTPEEKPGFEKYKADAQVAKAKAKAKAAAPS
jgi:hypothetical protein